MASEGSPSRGGEDSTQVIRIGRSVQIVIEKKSNLTGREKGTNREGSSMRRCSVLRERWERLGREHAGHALDVRHDGLEEVLAGVRADAGHDVRISGRADDLLDLGDVLQSAHGLLRVRRPNEEVRVAGVPIFLTRGPVL